MVESEENVFDWASTLKMKVESIENNIFILYH